ncbi:hypothetical protein [Bacillus norwichensis]|uniref:Lipoprotein n=1 Tax=Bacillus norwichensis TaxID=2762217 RepID=A0ABR8VGH9_9BACI|nr:hypothetical protein [Bacillus norwichensis]MBD8003701.1 hypothetical protein [Bacillus norwichensis]
MKNLLILGLSVLLLAGCTEKNDPAKDATNAEESEAVQSVEPENKQQQTEDNSTELSDKESDDNSAVENENNYMELPVVFEEIGSDEFEQIVQTDNPNKRVIFLGDQTNNKKFKSIYIKHDKRLKIIDLTNDQLIFNEVL